MISKTLRVVGNYLLRKYSDNYLYEYSKVQYQEYYKKLNKLPVETISKYQTGYFENIIEKISELVKKILQAEYVSIVIYNTKRFRNHKNCYYNNCFLNCKRHS